MWHQTAYAHTTNFFKKGSKPLPSWQGSFQLNTLGSSGIWKSRLKPAPSENLDFNWYQNNLGLQGVRLGWAQLQNDMQMIRSECASQIWGERAMALGQSECVSIPFVYLHYPLLLDLWFFVDNYHCETRNFIKILIRIYMLKMECKIKFKMSFDS